MEAVKIEITSKKNLEPTKEVIILSSWKFNWQIGKVNIYLCGKRKELNVDPAYNEV